MPNYLLIKNGTIFTHNKTIYNMDLLIEDDKIVEMQANISAGDNCDIIDASGMYIVPGLVDMHCDICEPGFNYKEDYESAGDSAIAGGFTSITCNPNSSPVIDNKAVVEYVSSKANSECDVHVYPYGSFTVGCLGKEITEVGEMQLAGAVAVSDGDLAIQDISIMKNIFQYCSMFDIPLIVHCEDTKLSNGSIVNDGMIATQLGLDGAPSSAETTALARNVLLAEEFNAHLHVCHISTKRSLDIIRMAKKNGIKVTSETSPQYFTLDETAVTGFNSLAKVNPPLRRKEDVEEIIKGIADGTIDVISSDHKPNTIDSKDVEFELASHGISSFETAFSLAYTHLVDKKYMTMETLIERMSFKPSQILTLNKGKIGLDQVADLVIFDPNQEFIVDSSKFQSKANYSPYDGKLLKGLIKYTLVAGKKYEVNIDARIQREEE